MPRSRPVRFVPGAKLFGEQLFFCDDATIKNGMNESAIATPIHERNAIPQPSTKTGHKRNDLRDRLHRIRPDPGMRRDLRKRELFVPDRSIQFPAEPAKFF